MNNNPNINDLLCEMIDENNISLALLAECPHKTNILLEDLAKNGIRMQEYFTAGCDRISIIGVQLDISAGRQTDYASFQILNKKDIFCCVHLPSKVYNSSNGMRRIAVNKIMADIASTENELNSENTLIVGDFNANPYDYECLDAMQFHGMPFYEEAAKKTRQIAGQEFKMFYNPMWNFFGDNSKPFGTYYYSGNDACNTFWNIYDQVLLRPSLRNRFVDSSLQIITETTSCYLLNLRGHPDKRISDHLPIIFELMEDYDGKEN